jgi:citrate lyase subunit beta / citryl-CoA lyase
MTAERGEAHRFTMRSKLFVPGDRPALFSKALRSLADAVCFDLEDAVLPEQKATARSHVKAFLQSNAAAKRRIAVRVNDLRSAFFAEDLSAVVWPGVALVNIPKTEDPSELNEVAASLSKLEQQRGITQAIAILPTIESPRGLRLAHAIGQAGPRVAGLQLGLVDLFSPLGISAQDKTAAHQVRLLLRLAAGEADILCFDSAFPDFTDVDGFAEEAAVARSLGFSGKSCIHPNQIAAANRIFLPTAKEVDAARRIVDAAREAAAEERGVFALDGRMIDRPIIRRAEEIIQVAASLQKGGTSEA